MVKANAGSLVRIAARISGISHLPNVVSTALFAAEVEASRNFKKRLASELERIISTSPEPKRSLQRAALGSLAASTSLEDLRQIERLLTCGNATGLSRLKVSGDGISASACFHRADASTDD